MTVKFFSVWFIGVDFGGDDPAAPAPDQVLSVSCTKSQHSRHQFTGPLFNILPNNLILLPVTVLIIGWGE